MTAALRTLEARGAFADFADFADPEGFDRLMRKLACKSWVVYAKKPFRKVDHVLKYLGRYTHRVAIANSRLVDVREHGVTFRTKNGKAASLAPTEFLRRFVQHVLPGGFHKIRQLRPLRWRLRGCAPLGARAPRSSSPARACLGVP